MEHLGIAPVLYTKLEETPWEQVEGFMATKQMVCPAARAAVRACRVRWLRCRVRSQAV